MYPALQLLTVNSTSIFQASKAAAFSIYPNPANDICTIKIDNASKPINSALIYNTLGVLVQQIQTKESSTQINVNHLAKGVYFIKTDNQIGRLVVN